MRLGHFNILCMVGFAFFLITSCQLQKNERSNPQPIAQASPTPTVSASPSPSPSLLPSPSPSTSQILPKYPVVFLNGFGATKSYGSFHKLESLLADRQIKIYVADAPSFSTIATRAESISVDIDKILQSTGATKVNLVAHSMGGLDARYLISTLNYASKVASLTTMSTPHRGTELADAVFNPSSDDEKEGIYDEIFGGILSNVNNILFSFIARGLKNLTTAYVVNEFNPVNSNSTAVYYQSYGANTGSESTDKIKATLLIPFNKLSETLPKENDGVVRVESAKWGSYRGTLDADHWDLVCIKSPEENKFPFDCTNFYSNLLLDLASRSF